MAERNEELVRLSPDEHRLVQNFRRCCQDRQDVLIYFSDELVKQEPTTTVGNVFLLTGRKP
jgi:hypothetical protein